MYAYFIRHYFMVRFQESELNNEIAISRIVLTHTISPILVVSLQVLFLILLQVFVLFSFVILRCRTLISREF